MSHSIVLVLVVVLVLEKTFSSQRVGVFPMPHPLGESIPIRHATLKTTFEDEDEYD
jgi:hypothetical protein